MWEFAPGRSTPRPPGVLRPSPHGIRESAPAAHGGPRIEIVIGRIRIAGRHRSVTTAMPPAVGPTKLDAGDLGDGAPSVGRLQRTGRRRLRLLDRPRREFAMDTRRTKKRQAVAAGVAGMDDVRFDRHIVIREFCGEGVVRVNAVELGRREQDGVGPILLELNSTKIRSRESTIVRSTLITLFPRH